MSKKSARTQQRYTPLTIFLMCALLALTLLAIWAYGAVNRQFNITQSFSAITKNTEATYSNIAVKTDNWPAQMGSQIALHDEAFDFSVSSQSMPSMYSTMRDPSAGQGAANATSVKAAHGIIAAEMKATGMKASDTNNKLPFIHYTKGDTQCLEQSTSDVLTLSCYKQGQIATVSVQLQPFASMYNTRNPNTLGEVFGPFVVKSKYGAGVIGSSHTAGYDIAEGVVTRNGVKKLVLFYNKNGGPWLFIDKANDEYGFKCEAYTVDPDIRAAMQGQICLGSEGHVRLDSTDRALQ